VPSGIVALRITPDVWEDEGETGKETGTKGKREGHRRMPSLASLYHRALHKRMRVRIEAGHLATKKNGNVFARGPLSRRNS